ncbi:hypothetical protein ABH932_001496 [Streptacidiphilus sp. MAP5-52]
MIRPPADLTAAAGATPHATPPSGVGSCDYKGLS